MSRTWEVFDTIRKGSLSKDISKFTNNDLRPFLPYLVLTAFQNEWSTEFDELRQRLLAFPGGNNLLLHKRVFDEYIPRYPKHQVASAEAATSQERKVLNLQRELLVRLVRASRNYFELSSTPTEKPKSKGRNGRNSLERPPTNKEARLYPEIPNFTVFEDDVSLDVQAMLLILMTSIHADFVNFDRRFVFFLNFSYGPSLIAKLIMNQPHLLEPIMSYLANVHHGIEFLDQNRDDAITMIFKFKPSIAADYFEHFMGKRQMLHNALTILLDPLLIDSKSFVAYLSRMVAEPSIPLSRYVLIDPKRIDAVMIRVLAVSEYLSNSKTEDPRPFIVLLALLATNRNFRRRPDTIPFALKFLADSMPNMPNRLLPALLVAFVASYASQINVDTAAAAALARKFFGGLQRLTEERSEGLETFNEIVLLLAIHFETSNDAELKKLIFSQLGYQTEIGPSMFREVGKVFLESINVTQLARLAIAIDVTPGLNANMPGYLPVHCINYLLDNKAFKKSGLAIEDWIKRQLLECRKPCPQVMLSVVWRYAQSCMPAAPNSKEVNRILDERFLFQLFSEDVIASATDVTPQLLAFYFVTVFTRAGNTLSFTVNFPVNKPYSRTLHDLIPVKHLLRVMDADLESYHHIAVHLSGVLADSVEKNFQDVTDVFLADRERNLIRPRASDKIPDASTVRSAAENLVSQPQAFEEILRVLKSRSTAKSLIPYLGGLAAGLHRALDLPGLRQGMLDDLVVLWTALSGVEPRKLYEETLKRWFSSGDRFVSRQRIHHAFVASDPVRLFRVDSRVFKVPQLFRVFLRMLDYYLSSKQDLTKAIVEKYNVKATETQAKENNVLQMAYTDLLHATVIQMLLEVCDEEINATPNMSQIRGLAFGAIHGLFLTYPALIRVVHMQCYPVKYVPLMVEYCESAYAAIDVVDELIRQRNIQRRVFAIHLVAHIVAKYRVEKYVTQVVRIESLVTHELNFLEPGEKVIFALNILSALEVYADTLPATRSDISNLLEKAVHIAYSRLCIYTSTVAARQSPEKKLIKGAKLLIHKLAAA